MQTSPPLRIAGVYVLFAAVWIWCSDRAVEVLVADETLRMELQTLKGWGFVLATGLLLYWMIRRDVRRLERSNSRLRLGREQALRVLVTAMDVRHQETGHHSERVARMAAELGRLDGVRGRALDELRLGALLHDIGKLALPDTILTKPGPLDERELALMRQHPRIGHELLQQVDFLRGSSDVPHSHHERWDGGGYPQGLRGEEIPLAARIFSVIDVWDALITERVYKPAWPEERVLAYLREVAGSQLDPRLVELFLGNYADLKRLAALPDTAFVAPVQRVA
ncbi:HD-GYP domain-containing protein [Rhodanobacter aciditrophus]|uniref:HD-GYP domain-containing protein n=1 Tax=Rhodanobacter aciditrophus TaxID=1623218 RepID=UPI003CEA65FC